MNKLLVRTISGFVFALITILSIEYSEISISLYLFIVMLICLNEFKRLLEFRSFWIGINASLIFLNFALRHWVNVELPDYTSDLLAYALTLGIIAQLISILFVKKEEKLANLKKAGLCLLYIPIPFTFGLGLGYVLNPEVYISMPIFAIFLLLWSNDSFAFLIGKNIGRTPLAPKISPKKTVEGFVGGVVSTVLMATLLSFFDSSLSPFEWTFLALITSVMGVIGDLLESFFKRKAGVKDSGNIIPGHGGFLDRLDSFILAAPFAYVYLTLIL